MTFPEKIYEILFKGDSLNTILSGLWVTIRISFLALLLTTWTVPVLSLLHGRALWKPNGIFYPRSSSLLDYFI